MRAVLVLSLVLAAMLPPPGAAQEPVASCKRQCEPTAPDVNPKIVDKGPVNVILYAHWESLLGDTPLNTQAPDPIKAPDINRGFLIPIVNASSGVCLPRACGNVNFDNGAFRFNLCPGKIHYEGRKRIDDCFHSPFRGISLSGETIVLYWYMSLESIPNGETTERSLSAMPQVGVAAQIRNPEGHRGGRVVAASEPPGLMAQQRVNMVAVPGSPNVYEFRVPLEVLDTQWIGYPEGAGIGHNIVLDVLVYQVHDGNGNQVAQGDWRIRSGAKFPTRLVVPVQDPLEAPSAAVTVGPDGALRARFSLFASLGHYDADPGTFSLTVTGPAAVAPQRIGTRLARHPYDAHGSARPTNISYAVDLDGLPAGTYVAQFEAMNLQKTYRLRANATYEFAGPASEPIPSPHGAPLLAGILFAALAFARRRSRA